MKYISIYTIYVVYEIKTQFCYLLMPDKYCGIALRISMVRQRDSMQPQGQFSLEKQKYDRKYGYGFVYPTIASRQADKARALSRRQ